MQAKAKKKSSSKSKGVASNKKKNVKTVSDFVANSKETTKVSSSKKSAKKSGSNTNRKNNNSKKIVVSDIKKVPKNNLSSAKIKVVDLKDAEINYDKIIEAGIESEISGFWSGSIEIASKNIPVKEASDKKSASASVNKTKTGKTISDFYKSPKAAKKNEASRSVSLSRDEQVRNSKNNLIVADLDENNSSDSEINSTRSGRVLKQVRSKKESVSDVSEIKNEKLLKKQKRKLVRRGLLVFLFAPITIFGLIVHSHSQELFSKPVIVSLLVVSLIALIISIVSFFRLRSFKKENGKLKSFRLVPKMIFGLFVLLYVCGCAAGIYYLYGPDYSFRDWLVTTAMRTKSHHHYATWFYSKEEINEVFKRNYIHESRNSTDNTALVIPDEIVCSDEYDCEVLQREEGAKYKIINFEINGCEARLVAIYDPSEVHVATTEAIGSYGQFVEDIARRENAYIAINGGGFVDPHFKSNGAFPRGIVIKNGEIITDNTYGYMSYGGLVGFNNDNKLVLLRDVTGTDAINAGIRDAVSWGPFLIVNGEQAEIEGNGGWGYAARTAIGQRADGIVLFLVVDGSRGRFNGATMGDVMSIMQRYGAINASNMDGGTSSVMIENGVTISHPIDADMRELTRAVPTAWVGISN